MPTDIRELKNRREKMKRWIGFAVCMLLFGLILQTTKAATIITNDTINTTHIGVTGNIWANWFIDYTKVLGLISNYYNKTEAEELFNYTADEEWINLNSSNAFVFNSSRLETRYFNVSEYDIIAGTVDGGTVDDTKHSDGRYDEVTLNISETSGSPALDIRFNFTGIDEFTVGVMRYMTSNLQGELPVIMMYNYEKGVWEDYPIVGEANGFFATITQPVFNADALVNDDGVVQMRIYKSSNGNTNNKYYIDWIAIAKGYGVPSGEEVDPHSYHTNENINATGYNITADNFFGNGLYYNASVYIIYNGSAWIIQA